MKKASFALFPAALLCCAGPALLAQVEVSGRQELPEGEISFYQARLIDAPEQPSWIWSIASGPGTIVPSGASAGRYRAPASLLEPQAVTIRAVSLDGKHSGEKVIQVTPDHRVAGPWIKLLAGHPREKGARQSLDIYARFQELAHAVWLEDGHPDPRFLGKWLLADAGNHHLLAMGPAGHVELWLGGNHKAGAFKDGGASEARFNFPTGIELWPRETKARPGDPWRALIADSGNHCLRLVRATARGTTVSTYAGKGEEAGCQDGALAEARFCVPRAAVFGPDGAIYVADAGNGMIRKIFNNKVTVLAGRKQEFHERRQVDGRGTEACFWAPEALVVDPRNGNLYVSDLCAIRRISPDGTVATVAGVLSEEAFFLGFEEWLGKEPQDGKAERMAGIPCLNYPKGLTLVGNLLVIADNGNHAVRVLNVDTGRLSTLAGDSEQRGVKQGRPRAAGSLSTGNPSTGGYATLAYPSHVACNSAGEWLILLGGMPKAEDASCILRMKRDSLGATGASVPSLPGQREGKADGARSRSLEDEPDAASRLPGTAETRPRSNSVPVRVSAQTVQVDD